MGVSITADNQLYSMTSTVSYQLFYLTSWSGVGIVVGQVGRSDNDIPGPTSLADPQFYCRQVPETEIN